MKFGVLAVSTYMCLSLTSLVGCSRNRQEAILLANQADKEVKINPDGAATKYDQATKLDPTNHRIFYKLAMAYRAKEDWAKVASTLAQAVRCSPETPNCSAKGFANYWFERGYALEMQAKKKTISYEEAKEPYQKCIEADPNFADCYEQIGNVYLWTDDEQKALENYTKAIEHNPTEIRYFAALADLYIRTGFYKEAEATLKEAKSFAKAGDRMLYGVHVLLSKVYQEKGQVNEMVAELEAAKAVVGSEGSEAVQILFNLGSTYAQLTPPRTQEAIQMLKGFYARACKGSKAQSFKVECETAQTQVARLGGNMQ